MIRDIKKEDLVIIDLIGSLIRTDFVDKNNIKGIFDTDYRHMDVYEDDEVIKGFVEYEDHIDFIDILNIAIKEKYQREGIGTILLNNIIKNNKGKRILLEVRESNAKAINFYLKNNFKEINRRRKYYGIEDAIIMERSI